ncbi:uncharacterized protein RCC_08887 [Ramularia collo-cygni]|uniref:Uncharacterized protein n=1 Tax=Ramularia collo-cygni TaxID=112498 RepID=A0A2D3UYM0_9PEZI|nr:uncharacterized protein RCC_08887 [Ramularia collo-cygni]CZT23177.1 uncharacterized protein RCC_08887 [Ramularia collo-cygni]
MTLLRPVVTRISSTRAFSSTSAARASPLFHLSALSNRNETAHFNQLSRLNRVNHSPALELIRESEVKPFTKKDAETQEHEHEQEHSAAVHNTRKEPEVLTSRTAATPSSTPILQLASHSSSPSPPVDIAMLQTLQQMSTQLANLEARLVEMGMETEKDVRRTGALVTVLVFGAVAGLGVWKFWPPESVREDAFARKHVQERSRILPADVVAHHHPATSVGAAMGEPAIFPTQHSVVASPVAAVRVEQREGSSWKNLLWKKD